MEHLNRVPQANDSLEIHGLEMIVESMERNRVLWIKARRQDERSRDLKQ
jgi:CBS domain containing-hemolysin-like protein